MRTTNEYVPCPRSWCTGWARVERGEKGYRDRLICSKCGCIVVADDIPQGQKLMVKESDGNERMD